MLLNWMAYSVLFGALLYAAAIAGDRLAATWNRSQRVVWTAALIVAAVAPALIALRPRAAETAGVVATASVSSGAIDVTMPAIEATRARASIVTRAKRIVAMAESYVVPLWFGASIAWLALFLRGAIGLHRQRARWRAAELDGVRVLVAPNVGPAVIGVLAPSVVIPEWALSLDDSARALMLQHEAEHIRARDPLLLVGGALMTALFPWNPALWALVRRLRLAIEIDCDRRVLGASARQREYGLLLLTVGARQSVSLPLATSLAERRPFLERRIRAMTTTTSRHPRLVSAACIALALVATTAAVRAPHPASLVVRETPQVPQSINVPAVPAPTVAPVSTPEPAPAPRVEKARKPALTQASTVDRVRRGPDSLTVEQIRSLIATYNPSALTGDPDINTITLVLTADNRYVVSLAEWRKPMVFGGGRVGGGGEQYDLDAVKMEKMKVAVSRGRGAASQDTDTVRAAELKMALEKLQTIMEERRQKVDRTIDSDSDRAVVKAELAARLGKATDERKTILGEQLGINTDALSRLIDMDAVESVHLRNFAAGELGTTALHVYIVKQKP